MNEEDEELQYLNLLRQHLYIANSQIISDFGGELKKSLNKIFLTGRNTFLLILTSQFFTDVKDFSNRIESAKYQQFKDIISILIPEKTNYNILRRQTFDFMETNQCQYLLRTAISTLKIFALGIHHYFSPQRQNQFKSEYFGTIIFPSIFSYFSFNEMIESSYQLLMSTMIQATYEFHNSINDTHFFNGALNDAEGIMFSSFFNGFPHFVSGFCHFFINLINQNESSFHAGSVFEFTCKSLEFSCQYLTPFHVKVIEYVQKYRKIEFFLNFFMIRVLQNNLSIYLDGDFELKCKCHLSKKSIINEFENFTKKLEPFQQEKILTLYMKKIINCKTFSFPFQSFEKISNKSMLSIYISEFDVNMIYSILQSSGYSFTNSLTQIKFKSNTLNPNLVELMISFYYSSYNVYLKDEIERNLKRPINEINENKNIVNLFQNEENNESVNENEEINKKESKEEFILSDIRDQLKHKKLLKKPDKNALFNEFEDSSLMKKLFQTKEKEIDERYFSILKNLYIDGYQKNASVIEKYIDNKLNESHLDFIFQSFKQRQEVFLSYISTVITNSIIFTNKPFNDFICPEQYIFHFNYLINNSKSALMNPYFELIGYKEVHQSSKFDVLMHQNQLLHKYKNFFDSEIQNSHFYIKDYNFEGKRKMIIDELILTLKNINKVPINDRLHVISNVISRIFQIEESLKFKSQNVSENIFLFVYLESNSDDVLPTFLIYSYLFNNNKLFHDILNEFNPNIKKAIDLLDNAIVNIFLKKKSDLQFLIKEFKTNSIID